MSLFSEFQTIIGLIDNGGLLNKEISSILNTSQRKMHGLTKDELMFVTEVEKRKLHLSHGRKL